MSFVVIVRHISRPYGSNHIHVVACSEEHIEEMLPVTIAIGAGVAEGNGVCGALSSRAWLIATMGDLPPRGMIFRNFLYSAVLNSTSSGGALGLSAANFACGAAWITEKTINKDRILF